SIRQIIADDDAAGAPRRPAPQAAPTQDAAPRPIPLARIQPQQDDALDNLEPLALSADQIVVEEAIAKPAPLTFDSVLAEEVAETPMPEISGEPDLVDPEDISFEM